MRLYRWLSDFHGSSKGIALAIGNFDGFHIGHQAVISRMQDKARQMGLESAVLIFEPQPMEFFARSIPPRLFSIRDKLRTFRAFGVENVFCLSFTRKFADQDDKAFVAMLRDQMGVKSVTVGSPFNFGKGGAYTFENLRECCQAAGIECSAVDRIEQEGERISSTMIRGLVNNGDFDTVERFLGRPYSIAGRVVHGNALGRTMGFPTANINLNRRVCPLKGVYAVEVRCGGLIYGGVANVGYRPTLNTRTLHTLLEVHILDFSGDIYGQEIEVFFRHKIRDEMKFSGLDQLAAQINADKEKAARLLGR
ncbi:MULTISPECIES: bifunctional riboflavin kinase/FAD synthetase [unclassified Anaerobiospirillum]|uniref:bifunctional riboflavin kinase/FAD synthetase n=1 Tax=unclassified Anaerobiospirillum TaxID=2647410 RepID=UPI001FF3F781|nr:MULTISPECIES: bifunctional riboflavin kinase/FAD synthetase [unclassified Anaerobiospirillum]MCK0535939.1 bifunctional riboflavin kinase/FAD synthetase [Anaerobiospirillum sp. NML120511]MCK0539954.1 bifunctional riboflavin kinase/FAD synthetase [Anaerobiospirillum sp. NML02-A-032]